MGYEEVLAGNKKPEEIIGSSSLQAVLVSILTVFVSLNINRKKYFVATNESGLQLDAGDNLANDIAIFERAEVKLNDKYFLDAPKVVIEVDSKADLRETSYETEMEYYVVKSRKMLDFGVEKVVWIFTHGKKVLISEAGKDWRFADFDRDMPLLDDCVLNVAKLLADEAIEF